MSRRYFKGMELREEQAAGDDAQHEGAVLHFPGHTVLIVYAAFAMSVQAWGFISGGLFYLLFAAYFLLEWIRIRRRQRKADGIVG